MTNAVVDVANEEAIRQFVYPLADWASTVLMSACRFPELKGTERT
jgi:hypothetical protein